MCGYTAGLQKAAIKRTIVASRVTGRLVRDSYREGKGKKERKQMLYYLTPFSWLEESEVYSGLFAYRVPAQLAPVCEFNGSHSRETE